MRARNPASHNGHDHQLVSLPVVIAHPSATSVAAISTTSEARADLLISSAFYDA